MNIWLTDEFHMCPRGSILILVLIVISAMTIVAFGLAYQTRIEIRLANTSSQEARMEILAYSGLEAGKAILSEKELTCEHIAHTCRFYPHENNQKLFEQLNQPWDETLRIDFWIMDENALLDVNKSNSAAWENLPEFTRDKRACILDWTDTDSDTNPDGAEGDYYERLEHPTYCKNAPVSILKELLFVKNITRDNYLGSLLAEEPYIFDDFNLIASEDGIPPLITTFTTSGQATVNINTVSKTVLAALPGLDEQTGDIILAYRCGPDGLAGTDDDIIMENPEDLIDIESLPELHKELLSQYCCYSSGSFRIVSLAKSDQHTCMLMATLKILENKAQVLCVERLF